MLGDQVRGFGYLHDGSIDTVFRFLQGTVFNPDDSGRQGFIRGDRQRRDMEQFVLAFDSDLPPITGQQVTVSGVGDSALDARVELLIARAHAGFESKLLGSGARECELIARGTLAGESRGWLYQPGSSNFRADRDADPPRTLAELREQAAVAEQEVTFTCVPYGSGMRVALDRDLDGILDGDEF
jgi:hypothetical protein